jgi:hypothetical protein
MKKVWVGLILLSIAVIALGQEECCPDRTHTVGVGLSWILPNDLFVTARFWLFNRSAIELSLMEPIFHSLSQVRISTVRIIGDFCIFRPYLSNGLTLPIGNMNWQRLEGLIGLEYCINKDLSLNFSGGLHLLHYYACCKWDDIGRCIGWCWFWSWSTLFQISFQYYLP